jgi:hypothetical protein
VTTAIERIEALDMDLFAAIPSQTSAADRRSLLAVQRATARRHPEFAYLEIGSHLGGSIQPYLLDPRCTAIYSIDARPSRQPDDRAPGYVAAYDGNSTGRMLGNLRALAPAEVAKVRCFDADASAVDPAAIVPQPHAAFIDGEHTRRAVLSDFAFCSRVLAPGGAIVFDDFPIVYPAVLQVVKTLREAARPFVAARLEGKVFGVFFDPETVAGDPFLSRCRMRSRFTLRRYALKLWAKSLLPGPAGRFARRLRRESRAGG